MEAVQSVVTQSPAENGNVVKGKAEKKSGKRIGYNYIILKSLKESQKNDVVKCLYIKSLTNWGICVIKEGTYGDSKDKQGRDIKDRLMWQKQLHSELQDIVRLPRLLGSFEENGNYYLVLERIKGISLYKAIRENSKNLREALITGNKLGMKFLDYMIQIIDLLDTMHQHQVVHRDVTATNFMIMPNGKVAIIDMELSYSLKNQFPDPPFQLGTYGYMSPEQEAMAEPSISQEIFSVGAIMLQLWTGIWPTKLTGEKIEDLYPKVHFFVPDKIFADIILQCLQPASEKRPSLCQVKQTLISYKSDLSSNARRPLTRRFTFDQHQILETVQQAIITLATPLLADKEKGWFSEDQNLDPNPDKRRINKAWYTSFNKGACGVIYFLSKANLAGMNVEFTRPHIQTGLQLIESKYINRISEVSPSLHSGSSGIAACLSQGIDGYLVERNSTVLNWIQLLLAKENGRLGFTHGLAGQGIANILCETVLPEPFISKNLRTIVQELLLAQEKDGSWSRGIKDDRKRITRGFAHGVAGIVYFLLEYAHRFQYQEVMNAACNGLLWLGRMAEVKKESIQWLSSNDKKIAPWWCEGAPGIALTFMKAFSLTGELKYRKYAIGALLNHQKDCISNNLSQCHGLTGLGEVYLEAFHILGESEWLERATWIAQVIMQLMKRHKEFGPYWLVQYERQPIADFMVGNSGILHFLLRVCYHDKIKFPLLP